MLYYVLSFTVRWLEASHAVDSPKRHRAQERTLIGNGLPPDFTFSAVPIGPQSTKRVGTAPQPQFPYKFS